jgi:hypothetical protein
VTRDSSQYDTWSSSDLRRSLFQTPAPQIVQPPAAPILVDPDVPPPSPPELLGSSAALQRLCESYHRIHSAMVWRSRRQRIGIALLVSTVSVVAFLLSNTGAITATTVSDMVLAVAGAGCAGLAVMAMLWVRDDRRLRDAQGPRLLRALQTSCTLPTERILAFRVLGQPTVAFFDCYEIWCTDHALAHSRLAPILALLKRKGPIAA